MQKILINYGDDKYSKAKAINTFTGRKIGKFDKIFSYSSHDIDKSFREKHRDIFKEKRGDGLWLWKSYLICKTIDNCDNGDIIFSCDSGAFFIRDPQHIYSYLTSDHPLLSVIFH